MHFQAASNYCDENLHNIVYFHTQNRSHSLTNASFYTLMPDIWYTKWMHSDILNGKILVTSHAQCLRVFFHLKYHLSEKFVFTLNVQTARSLSAAQTFRNIRTPFSLSLRFFWCLWFPTFECKHELYISWQLSHVKSPS